MHQNNAVEFAKLNLEPVAVDLLAELGLRAVKVGGELPVLNALDLDGQLPGRQQKIQIQRSLAPRQ
jgi:hypothetical protein